MLKTLMAGVLAASLFVPTRAQALENQDLLALVAMPLAVAAVSEMTDVPMNELMNVVSLLNDAAVPPPQFIEVVRYVPVALVADTTQPGFVDFLRTSEEQGLNGIPLVTAIEDRYRVYGINDVDFDRPSESVINVDGDFIPPVVRTRVVEARTHPHGGPPGQLKKELGLQTGAEVVHGTKPGRSLDLREEPARVVGGASGKIRHEKPAHKQKVAHGAKQNKAGHQAKPAHKGKPSAALRYETTPQRAPSNAYNGGGREMKQNAPAAAPAGGGKHAGGNGGGHGGGHGKGRGKG